MKLLIVVQARTGSSRLPGKVLMRLAGQPMLVRMIERVQATNGRYPVMVATTTEPEDDPIRFLCQNHGIPCFMGHPTDLLDRHYQLARLAKAEVVVKIPSDCPLIDPQIIDHVISYFMNNPGRLDFASNLHPATYPDGNDVEVMSFKALELAHKNATLPHEREHTTPYIWDNPAKFSIGNVPWESGGNLSMSHRWTIDYPEDYEFIKTVYDELWRANRPIFTLWDILGLLTSRPEIAAINAKYAGMNWYRLHLDTLRTIQIHETRLAPEI